MLGIAAQNIPRAVHHHVQWIQVADVSWGPGYGIYGIYGNSVLTYLDVQMGKKWAKRTKLNTQEAMRPYIYFGALPPMGVAGVHVLDGFTQFS